VKQKSIRNFFKNPNYSRVFTLIFTSLAVLGTAFSCSGGLFNRQETVYGVLKRDAEVRQEGFVKANAVEALNGSVENQGLSSLSTSKILQIDSEKLFILTREKGVFKTVDGGLTWQRLYVFPISKDNQEEDLIKNDDLVIIDFDVPITSPKVVYLAAIENGISKVFQSFDEGENFQEVYSEVQSKDDISFIRVNPVEPLQVFTIIEGGALLRSLDGGLTWQKIRSFRDLPVGMGFVPEFDQTFYILFQDSGLATSKDLGLTWDLKELIKNESQIGERQPTDGLDINFREDITFGKYEKIIPVTAKINFDFEQKIVLNPSELQPWVLIADRQMWISSNLSQEFNKLILPSQAEQYNLFDVSYDPVLGLDKIYVSIDNRLFFTTNRGQSWFIQDMIKIVDGEIGNISQVLVDKNDPNILYLTLVDKRATRRNGFISF